MDRVLPAAEYHCARRAAIGASTYSSNRIDYSEGDAHTTHRPMNATKNPTIVYLRVSTAEQETDSQEHHALEYCRVRGWHQVRAIVREIHAPTKHGVPSAGERGPRSDLDREIDKTFDRILLA